jgi:uncharacterized membrane protein
MPLRLLLLNFFSSIWCCVLLAMRIHLAGNTYYSFMVWNLFLAGIPLVLSLALPKIRRLLFAVPLLTIWLLFFPNAPYVLTDLMHLSERAGNVPKWLDLLMLLSFSLVSLGFGFQSLQIVQNWFAQRISLITGWCVALGTLALSGFGIYLGRFLRWNSWDILHRPHTLLNDIAIRFADPLDHTRTWGCTLGFGTLLIFAYLFWISSATTVHGSRKLD